MFSPAVLLLIICGVVGVSSWETGDHKSNWRALCVVLCGNCRGVGVLHQLECICALPDVAIIGAGSCLREASEQAAGYNMPWKLTNIRQPMKPIRNEQRADSLGATRSRRALHPQTNYKKRGPTLRRRPRSAAQLQYKSGNTQLPVYAPGQQFKSGIAGLPVQSAVYQLMLGGGREGGKSQSHTVQLVFPDSHALEIHHEYIYQTPDGAQYQYARSSSQEGDTQDGGWSTENDGGWPDSRADSRDNSREDSRADSRDKSRADSRDNSREDSRADSRDKSRADSRDNSREDSRGDSRDKSRADSRDKSREDSRRDGRDKSRRDRDKVMVKASKPKQYSWGGSSEESHYIDDSSRDIEYSSRDIEDSSRDESSRADTSQNLSILEASASSSFERSSERRRNDKLSYEVHISDELGSSRETSRAERGYDVTVKMADQGAFTETNSTKS